MSGGGVDAGGGGSRSRKKGKRKPKKRMNVRIDMTPLVDVAFLLLTFFMMTTVFRKPSTMEINLPPNDAKVDIAESNLLTIRIDEAKMIYYSFGIDVPKKLKFEDLKKFLVETSSQNPKMVVLLKIDRKGKFNYMVDVIDELNMAKLDRFSIAPMTEIDLKEMARAS
ncbi:MAG: biopolymer transporter ExbD [Ignavibacteriaceae bacterium]|nr:biopolymer transporter ExbD [Ignavibacteriaceae bacterium]